MRSIKLFYQEFLRLNVGQMAEALAFNTTLSILPIFGIVFWYMKRLPIIRDWEATIREYAMGYLNPAGEARFGEILGSLTANTESVALTVGGISLLVYTYWRLSDQFGDALDRVLCRKEPISMFSLRYLRVVGKRALLFLAIPITLAVSLGISAWLKTDPLMKLPALLVPASWLVNILILALVYYFAPSEKVSLKRAFLSAAIATPALTVAQFIFQLSAKHGVINQKLYGVFIALPLVMGWIYLSWQIVLCALLVTGLGEKREGAAPEVVAQ